MAELILHCEEEGFDAALLEAHALAGIDSDVPLSAELVFTDEAGIRALNAAERGIDAVTDVLSLEGIRGVPLRKEDFPFDIDEEGALFLGSVVICRERAAEQAQEYGHSLRREVYYLAVHGLCHLLGYDHETEEDKAEMRAREEAVLAEMNIARDEA